MSKVTANLNKWNDEKGFGFATPEGSSESVFLHVSDFQYEQRRPRVGDCVSFVISQDNQGRVRGINARLEGFGTSKDWKTPARLLLVTLALAFITALGSLVFLKKLPLFVLYLYTILSAITFAAYRLDKFAATNNNWRTQESTLQMLSLLFGWPGALMAQQMLRHKSRKLSFQIVYWIMMMLNCGFFAWLFTKEGQLLVWFVDDSISKTFHEIVSLISSKISR